MHYYSLCFIILLQGQCIMAHKLITRPPNVINQPINIYNAFSHNVVFCTISIAPAADCTEDFTFDRIKYHNKERGYRYLDGFVDCAAASEGNSYYVEDYESLNDMYENMIQSCFPPDGLCLNLTSENNGGWNYGVFDLIGENIIHNI